jgi:hypothetical protein
MDLERALAKATTARERQLEAHGDLLGCGTLIDAELFIVQVLIGMGRSEEASSLAQQILVREPSTELDPVKYPPAMQRLWAEVARRSTDRILSEPDAGRLVDLGRSVGADWVVLGTCIKTSDGGEKLEVLLTRVSTGAVEARHAVTLGAQGQWASEARSVLAEQFPPPPPPPAEERPSPALVSSGAAEEDGKVWYRSWWFWTAVGAVVIGGTAGAVGGYYANQGDGATTVEMDPSW